MKCPFCLHQVTPDKTYFNLGSDSAGSWGLVKFQCANEDCKRIFLSLYQEGVISEGKYSRLPVPFPIPIYPRTSGRDPVSPEVPRLYAEDYKEACQTLRDSPKASAALGRRCLQSLLRDIERIKPGDLFDEIQEVLNRKSLPSYLAENIDAIRNIGNFAAHPTKSKSSGEIVPVEPGEAEWILDTLEGLFDFYFVQPEKLRTKREALNKKLAEAGKPPTK